MDRIGALRSRDRWERLVEGSLQLEIRLEVQDGFEVICILLQVECARGLVQEAVLVDVEVEGDEVVDIPAVVLDDAFLAGVVRLDEGVDMEVDDEEHEFLHAHALLDVAGSPCGFRPLVLVRDLLVLRVRVIVLVSEVVPAVEDAAHGADVELGVVPDHTRVVLFVENAILAALP